LRIFLFDESLYFIPNKGIYLRANIY